MGSSIRPPEGQYWPTHDWKAADPHDQMMDGELLLLADTQIRTHLPHVYSLIVVRHGSIVFEAYYQGYSRDDRVDVQSVTKSVTGALVGIAVQEHALQSVQQPIAPFFPEYLSDDLQAEDKHAITIAHLLTMTAGFAWDEASQGQRLWLSDNWIRFTLALPLAAKPGATFAYNTGITQILAGLLCQCTQLSLGEFAHSRIFRPLGIERFAWVRDPAGINYGGVGLSLLPRDMAKFGYLFLNRGRWADEQIVPAWFVDESTRVHTTGGFPEEEGYGYHWWVTTERGYHVYFAAGYGGQYIYVVPDLALVAVMTANHNLRPSEMPDTRYLLSDFVIPAAARSVSYRG